MTTREAPWWLAAGSERCSRCGRRHHVEVSVRCVACDEPVCPFCVVTVRREHGFCPGCHEEEEAG